jgi:hypothetical protein
VKPPRVDDIRWHVTPDSLMAIAEKYWPAVELAVKELIAEYENKTLNLSDEERRRKPIVPTRQQRRDASRAGRGKQT